MMLLAFSGRAQSGKDSLGNFLIRNHRELFNQEVKYDFGNVLPMNVKKMGWADPLKRMVGDLFDVPDKWLWGSDEDKNNLTCVSWRQLPHFPYLCDECVIDPENGSKFLTVRELLQHFGTEICRRMGKDCWINASMKILERDKPDLAVFIDTRFPNEVECIKKRGGKVVRLTRKEDVPTTHESEFALDPDHYDRSNFDAVLDKDVGLLEQEHIMVGLLETWGWKSK